MAKKKTAERDYRTGQDHCPSNENRYGPKDFWREVNPIVGECEQFKKFLGAHEG